MNWGLIGTVAGVLLTFAGIKFVWVAFRTLFSRDTMEDVLSAAGDGFSNAGRKFGNFIKKKSTERKIAKAEEENKPIVIIR